MIRSSHPQRPPIIPRSPARWAISAAILTLLLEPATMARADGWSTVLDGALLSFAQRGDSSWIAVGERHVWELDDTGHVFARWDFVTPSALRLTAASPLPAGGFALLGVLGAEGAEEPWLAVVEEDLTLRWQARWVQEADEERWLEGIAASGDGTTLLAVGRMEEPDPLDAPPLARSRGLLVALDAISGAGTWARRVPELATWCGEPVTARGAGWLVRIGRQFGSGSHAPLHEVDSSGAMGEGFSLGREFAVPSRAYLAVLDARTTPDGGLALASTSGHWSPPSEDVRCVALLRADGEEAWSRCFDGSDGSSLVRVLDVSGEDVLAAWIDWWGRRTHLYWISRDRLEAVGSLEERAVGALRADDDGVVVGLADRIVRFGVGLALDEPGCSPLGPALELDELGPSRVGGGSATTTEETSLELGTTSVRLERTCAGDCPTGCEGECTDGLDGDRDGAVDCADVDCVTEPACAEADPDGDGVPTGSDCAPADAANWSVPPEVDLLFVEQVEGAPDSCRLRWTSAADPGATELDHEAIAGRLDALLSTGRLEGTCRDAEARLSCRPARYPWLAHSTWYLVRALGGCGPGPWRSGGGSPDAEACP